MPYTTSTSDGKVTVFKKIGKRKEVVGHTTPQKKKGYLAALHIHSKDKDMKKENFEFDNQIGDVYAVTKPWDGCQTSAMVHKVDPMMGIQNIEPQQVYGLYPDEDSAMTIAERLYGDHMKTAQMLEEKKGKVGEKLKKAIDKLEKKRKEHVNMVKEDPKNASKHKEEIANIASQIDDLMVKLERVEKSKKEEEKEEKEDLKEAVKTNSVPQLNIEKLSKILDRYSNNSDKEKKQIINTLQNIRAYISPNDNDEKIIKVLKNMPSIDLDRATDKQKTLLEPLNKAILDVMFAYEDFNMRNTLVTNYNQIVNFLNKMK